MGKFLFIRGHVVINYVQSPQKENVISGKAQNRQALGSFSFCE